jgi:MYXO-CTERM domain-containing protein
MATTDPPVPAHDQTGEAADRVGQLRGAGVSVDGRRVGQVAVGLVLLTLLVLTVIFTIVGIHTNQQNDRLHNDGVPVTFTVTGCLGLLGGSGSNAAGYSCHGTYTLDGKTYAEQLPGDSFHRPGSTVAAIAVPGDPALVSPASIVATEHSSAGVFVLPIILFAVLLLVVALLLVLRRRRPRGAGSQGSESGRARPAH